MKRYSQTADVVVIGGGPVGLACAWLALEDGLAVKVIDSGASGAWNVAAGMLAPVSEAEFGQELLLDLNLRASQKTKPFCKALENLTGIPVGYRETGTLLVARDGDDAAELKRGVSLRNSYGLSAEELLPSQAREIEPALAPGIRSAVRCTSDHSLEPRRFVSALREAVKIQGGHLIEDHAVAIDCSGRAEITIEGAQGGTISAEKVLIAAGAASNQIRGLPDCPPLRQVKGQLIEMRDRPSLTLVNHTVRSRDVYLVPRLEGHLVLGATVEERIDPGTTVEAIYTLLRDFVDVVPGILEMEFLRVSAGFRPAFPDNLPAIGVGRDERVIWASGHHRNGILLAPLTADLVLGIIRGDSTPVWADAINPTRFAKKETAL